MTVEHPSVFMMPLKGEGEFTSSSALKRIALFDDDGVALDIATMSEQIAAMVSADTETAVEMPTGSADTTGVADRNRFDAAIAIASAAYAVKGVVQVVKCPANQLYLMAPRTATINARNPSGSFSAYRYCIAIPDGVVIDLNGSTVRLVGSTQAMVFCNTRLDAAAWNHDLGLIGGGTVDGNNVAMSTHNLVRFGYIQKGGRFDYRVINTTFLGSWIHTTRDSTISRLVAEDIVGQGLGFGDPQSANSGFGIADGNNSVKNCTVGPCVARRCAFFALPSQPGNGIAGIFEACQMTTLYQQDCAGGMKIQFPGMDTTIGFALLDGSHSSVINTGNSGFKLQGDSAVANGAGTPISRTRVGVVVSRNQYAQGAFLDTNYACAIASYSGYNNAQKGDVPDVWMGGNKLQMGEIYSELSGSDGVYSRVYSKDLQLGNVQVVNPGSATGAVVGGVAAASKNGVSLSGSFRAGHVVAEDNRGGSAVMQYGTRVIDSAAVGSFLSTPKSTGHTTAAFATSSPFVFTNAVAVDVYKTPGTFTWFPPAGAQTAHATVIGAGGGGAAGRRGASGTALGGGGAGGGGGWTSATFDISQLGASEVVNVGAGGAGAAAQTADNTNGAAGTAGGYSAFATGRVRAQPGSGGTGGNITGSIAGGGGGTGVSNGTTGGSGGWGAAAGSSTTAGAGGAGGGGGGGVNATPAFFAGGAGGSSTQLNSTAGGAGGATDAAGGTPGSSIANLNLPVAGSGGGGGAGSIVGAAGAGAAGGKYGAGGGGGGASLNGFASGAGGAGADGIVVVISR